MLFVGMDVHAQCIQLAVALTEHSEVRLYGGIPNDLQALEKVFAKLRLAHPAVERRLCYDAGSTWTRGLENWPPPRSASIGCISQRILPKVPSRHGWIGVYAAECF